MNADEPWRIQTEALGAFIRSQRRMADLSLREMATLTHVSNAYLSQIERGLHQPSVRVLSAIARALDVPPDALLAAAGLLPHASPAQSGGDRTGATTHDVTGEGSHACSTAHAISVDPRLTDAQRKAMLGVYLSFTAAD